MSSFYKKNANDIPLGQDYALERDVIGLFHQVTFIPDVVLTDGQIKIMVKMSASAPWEDVEGSTLDLTNPQTISFSGFVERIKVVFVTAPTANGTYDLLFRGGGS